MDYLKDIGEANLKNQYGYKMALAGIEFNTVFEKFRQKGYRISNQSRFDIHDAPSVYATGLVPSKIQLINSKTLYYRVAKNLPYFMARNGWISWFAEKLDNKAISENRKILISTMEQTVKKDTIPLFSYLHLYMPHEPYSFDSTGHRMVPFWQRKSYNYSDKDQAYLQYLVYTNKKISSYVQELQEATKGQAVILLMSDHGYRDAINNGYKDIYQSLNAVYIPDKSETGWYDGMTNVNQFRVLFNTLFDARLPLLKDSIIQ